MCFLIAAPHAQEAGRTQTAPPAPAHNTMMLTGCLAAATSAVSKAAGEAKADPDPSKPIEKKVRPLTVTAIKQVLATCR